jgi:hypothetical protein
MMRIVDGQPEDHPNVLPLDATASPGVQAATPAFASGQQVGGVRDLTGERLSQLAASEAKLGAAMTAGMTADADRRGRYLASMQPLGASAGDLMPVANPPLDPAGPLGEAEPWGATYDPPRGA